MTKEAFIDLVRQYAAAARRKKKSFALTVKAVLQIYNAQVIAGSLSEERKTRELEWAEDFVKREYGSVDKNYGPAVES